MEHRRLQNEEVKRKYEQQLEKRLKSKKKNDDIEIEWNNIKIL